MKKILIIISGLLGALGIGYVFIKPSFKVSSIDARSQIITYVFDGKTYTYQSGLNKTDTQQSRGYTLTIKDSVLTIVNLAVSGSIIVEVAQFGKVIHKYEIKPADYNIYLWNWKK